MATTPDFGTALDMSNGLPLRWSFASGRRNLANALARRLQTKRGTLVHAPDYGLDVRQYVNASQTRAQVYALSSSIARECEKDPRVQAATVTTNYSAQTSTLTVTVSLTTAAGPFALVLAVTALTVQILGDLS